MFFFIKTLMNVDHICSFLLKLKVYFRIGPKSNYLKKHSLLLKNKCFHFILENIVSSIGEKNSCPSPPRKPNGLAVTNKNKKIISLESIPPYLLY